MPKLTQLSGAESAPIWTPKTPLNFLLFCSPEYHVGLSNLGWNIDSLMWMAHVRPIKENSQHLKSCYESVMPSLLLISGKISAIYLFWSHFKEFKNGWGIPETIISHSEKSQGRHPQSHLSFFSCLCPCVTVAHLHDRIWKVSITQRTFPYGPSAGKDFPSCQLNTIATDILPA